MPRIRCSALATSSSFVYTPKSPNSLNAFSVTRDGIEYESYAKSVNIEAKAMINIAGKQLIPAVVRYIYWAAGTAGGAIAGFIAVYCLAGFVAGLAALTVILSVGIVLIIFKQRKGLHSKRTDRGVFVYAYSRKV